MPAARDIKESVVDAAGEHISEEFKEKCVEVGYSPTSIPPSGGEGLLDLDKQPVARWTSAVESPVSTAAAPLLRCAECC
jgi:hypothetical protein